MILDLFRKEVQFKNIQGYDDIKDIVKRASDAEDNYNARRASRPMFVYCERSNCGESKTEIDRRVRGNLITEHGHAVFLRDTSML